MVEEQKNVLPFIKGIEAQSRVLEHASINGLTVVEIIRENKSVEIWVKSPEHNTTVCYYITDNLTVETVYKGV